MRDAAFVKACELVVEFRKQASHWKKLLFATSDELSAARHALSDLAKACEDLQKDQDCSFNNAVSDSIRKILGAVEGEFTIHAAERCVKVKDSLRDERDDLRKIVEMVHADLGIQPGDHIGEAISELKKEASDATARQRMTEARALNYSLQADEARREIERLRSEVESLRAKLTIHSDEMTALAAERDAHAAEVESLREEIAGLRGIVKERDGLLTQAQDQRAEIERLKLACDTYAADWDTAGKACRIRVGQQGVWSENGCEPCDTPEASHDTPAGKEAAEAAAEIKVDDVVEVVSASSCATFSTDIGRRGKVTYIGEKTIDVEGVPGYACPAGGVVSKRDVRKVPQ